MSEVITGEVASLQAGLERILAEYDNARQNETFGSTHPLWSVFTSIGRLFQQQPPLTEHPLVRVKWSVGQGKWTNVPHMSFLDSRETTTTQHGVYPVYLFRQDGSALYLAVLQGVTKPKEKLGTTAALAAVAEQAVDLRQRFARLAQHGFALASDMELRSDDPRLGKAYEASTVAYKVYEAGQLPSDADVRADLAGVLDAYEVYVTSQHAPALAELVAQWKDVEGYPVATASEKYAQRKALAAALTAEQLDQVIEDPGKFELLDFGQFAHMAYGNPGNMSIVHTELSSNPEAPRRLARALKHVLYDEGDVASRIDDVINDDEWRLKGFKESLVTKALAVKYPNRWLPLYQFEGDMGKRAIIGSPELGIALPDRLQDLTQGQIIRWSNDAIRHVLEPLIPQDPWGQMHFAYWLRDHQSTRPTGPTGADPLADVADELCLPQLWLSEVVTLLKEKKQLVFQGPPGTGKTYVARRLAKHFADLGGGMEVVQFHPSYAYEDFIEGYRPKLVAGQPGFALVEGPLRRLARKAEADRDHVYVLVIDELNRGNVAKVFGELYYLLEYRNDRIRLQYGTDDDTDDDGRFRLPENLWIIATMNTADRSIALMDAALRRRFYFVDYYPTEPPIDQLLETWLRAKQAWPALEWLVDVLAETNKRIGDRESSVGPSHFLLEEPADLTDERITRIWKYAVLPYITERRVGLAGTPSKDFALTSLKAAVAAAAADPAPAPAVDGPPGDGDGAPAIS